MCGSNPFKSISKAVKSVWNSPISGKYWLDKAADVLNPKVPKPADVNIAAPEAPAQLPADALPSATAETPLTAEELALLQQKMKAGGRASLRVSASAANGAAGGSGLNIPLG